MDGIISERIGNLHLVLLHLPIGFVVAAVLLEGWLWRRPSSDGEWLQGRLLAANAVTSLLVAGAGLWLASNGSYATPTLALHRWAGVICAGLAILAWVVRVRRGVWLTRITLGLLFVATSVAGHLGATLTHGTNVTRWWGADKERVSSVMPAKASDGRFIAEVQPILERACVECHGPDKAKGRLRVDSRAAVLAGGKSGLPAIVPGKPEASELVRRVKLSRDDEDAMPAGDEPGLTAAEIATLERWIAGGARW